MRTFPWPRLLFPLFLFALASAPAAALTWPARRRAQFQKDPGHAVFPYVYDLPGIGKGYGVLGGLSNMGGTDADLAVTLFNGDVNGQGFGLNSFHVVPRRLLLDAGVFHLNRTTLQSYFARGMRTAKEDYSLAEFRNATFWGSKLTATFDERRWEFFLAQFGGAGRFESLRDRDGKVIVLAGDDARLRVNSWVLGGRFDMTDDFVDPRRGLLVEPQISHSPRQGSGPRTAQTDANITAYAPVGTRNTWVFNFFQSDAHVLTKGVTDRTAIQDELGLDCASLSDPAEFARCRDYLDTTAAANARGTASSLGGFGRLRSYPEARYQGAHVQFIGTEFRWNVSDKVIPFNIYLLKDIRTAVQFAFFYELGTVADRGSDLWKTTRYSAGAGFRLATASGLVYRLDFAQGQEGFHPSIFFQYPWKF